MRVGSGTYELCAVSKTFVSSVVWKRCSDPLYPVSRRTSLESGRTKSAFSEYSSGCSQGVGFSRADVSVGLPSSARVRAVMLVGPPSPSLVTVSYTHLRAHETRHDLVCRLLLEK